jgi:hypothetical protein
MNPGRETEVDVEHLDPDEAQALADEFCAQDNPYDVVGDWRATPETDGPDDDDDEESWDDEWDSDDEDEVDGSA